MISSIGHIAIIKSTSESGLILGEINVNNTGWKSQFSYDDKLLIVRLSMEEFTIGELTSDEIILERLSRDIHSDFLQTRQWASEMLCNFIEESGAYIDFEFLKVSINKIVDRLSIEDVDDVGQKLSEGIFESICLQKLEKSAELELVKKLANLDKDYLYTYLDDEEYLGLEEVKEFIFDKSKWWNADD